MTARSRLARSTSILGLVQLRGGPRFGRLGLLQTGLEIGVVEHDELLALLHGLARLDLDLLDPGQDLRRDRDLVDGADRADGRLGPGPLDELDLDRAPGRAAGSPVAAGVPGLTLGSKEPARAIIM